ncbi:MAG TPA: sigma-70 family RNA polymerase sigma factor [candidate division Zixibacteria bacterium]|nr:sigma-70 family RNA polymerase sigma factor [candidate division Zixibacteria bacterium]MDD4916924.1 sigma-70 family RNA polymerase sigma factor [candidate division Zixibacteria bacterium]MDM7973077.1 sigma-70 family RNA polymerase sigma factor [candidate division Zixibacteria bacterium]HPI33023.1 sigma-70 family RNA polymerase sigma factor [candidate division Zixibacteria bacterium]HPM36369.1 sigma-70 family RNA polymerase sigma factor [candidate division Zixibacteria bacterium]
MAKNKETEKEIDYKLMHRVQDGDMVAFNELVERYKDRLMNVIGRMLSSQEEAEDIVQETFIRVYQHRQSFNFQHCFSTWIYTIGLNLARNELRKRKRFKHYDITEMQGNEAEFAVEMKLPSRLPQVIDEAVQELPEKYRLAFMLRDLQEMPYEEVARILSIPLGTVKSRVNRARLMLRDKLLPKLEGQNALSKNTLLPVSLL